MDEGFGVVWSPAVLAAEINAGLIQGEVADLLGREGINSQEDIMLRPGGTREWEEKAERS